ncbi:MAG TPA: valine--tRNA ligase [Chloroflexi bacterium]|nr:valine--tRNA ligase [Chloroflexota bacterium]HHW85199.1 valine--tRNA ligase [Chloroflexota bacterium]
MTTEPTMPKAYDPRQVEESLYNWWEQQGFFRPEQQLASGLADPTRCPFVISMPPPNVTGALHLGHALTSSIEDMLIRYHRMAGDPTLWVPGTDHAGIATQNVVERQLDKQGISRHDLGRERFVEEVWNWKAEYHARISAQQRRMGISCDWTRERFTLDEGLSKAVLEAFVRLYEEGLIYRGNYLVNWCPRCQSAISDLEVDHDEENGRFYTFRYPLKEGGFLEVSTTRPETILGDTAVAVHPDDPRYTHVVGKTALVPMLNREIPVIADAYVDPAFGTGALKVTPGHDPNDYEIGKRHGLPMINIMNNDGTLNANAGPYVGLDRFVARKQLWADMQAAGLVVSDKEHLHQVGHCQRCGTIVEPLLSEQWWVKMAPLAEPALAAVANGDIQIVPPRFERIYNHWLENIRDWCISRQLWWGHRIPVWYGPDGAAFAGRSEAEAHAKATAHYGKTVELVQDPDVLDTWFSSGLWPFSTLGWPEQTQDLATYYPTTVLETGYDILFFWVARMIMSGLKFTGKAPFSVVYLHGLVRDEQGRKMSKSLANVLNPLDLIAEYGTDALRFTLLTGGTPGNDMKLSTTRIEANRNFANKIWNAARFVVMKLQDSDLAVDWTDPNSPTYTLPDRAAFSLVDRWILSRYESVRREVNRLIETWQLGEAGRQLYEFLWNEYCDWYIEAAKVRLSNAASAEAQATRQVLAYVLERSLRLLHPFMPFVTEAIWQNLPGMAGEGRSIMVTRWPAESGQYDAQAEDHFGRMQEAIRGIRNVRSEYDVPAARRIAAHFSAGEYAPLVVDNLPVIAMLARLETTAVHVAAELAAPGKAATLAVAGMTIYLPLSDLIDLAAERKRIQSEIDNVDRQVQRIESTLANAEFVGKAPAAIVERERAKLVELRERRNQLTTRLADLSES